jgi:HK97 family phage major capsid protein
MPDNSTERLLAARSDIIAKTKRLLEIVEGAQTEGRDLSRRERAEAEQLRREGEELRSRFPAPTGQSLMSNGRGAPDTSEASDALRPEQRVSDWLRERGHVRSGPHEPEGLSFGKMVRGAVTGRWTDAEAEQRALSESSLAGGGYLLGPALSGTVIDRVRNHMRVMEAGATTVPLTTEQTYMARLASGAAPIAWHTEAAAITPSDMQFERVTFDAKTLPVIVKISAELFEDLSPQAAEAIEQEVAQALSLELDRACLRGSGATPSRRAC